MSPFKQILIILALFPFMAKAHMLVDVFLTHRKGIDQDLVLTTEVQSLEKLWGKEQKFIEMKNGIRLELGAEFVTTKNELIGPPSRVILSGRLFGPNKTLWLDFTPELVEVELGEEYIRIYHDEGAGQKVEIRLVPYI